MSASDAGSGGRDGAQAMFREAQGLHRQGRLIEAEALYRRLLVAHPGHVALLRALGDLCARANRITEAVDFMTRAHGCAPDDAATLSNLGYLLHLAGRSAEGLPHLQRASALLPQSAPAAANLGAVLAALGRHEEALAAFRMAASLAPTLADLHGNIGNALARLGRRDEAVAAFEQALALQPDSARTLNNYGNLLTALGRADQAEAMFARALALDETFALAHYNYASLLADLGRMEDAIAHYRRAAEIDPGHAATWNNLGAALNQAGRHDEALAAFERVLALAGDHAPAHVGIGAVHLFHGRRKEAGDAFRAAVALAPKLMVARRSLAEVTTFAPGDPAIAEMEALARLGDLPVPDRVELHFALAKAHADCGDHEAVFSHLAEGNALKRTLVDYDEAAHLAEMARAAERFSPALLHARSGIGDPSSLPVFVVGMPRSGTSLVEQVLASHPDVFGGGELGAFGHSVAGGYRPGASLFNPETCADEALTRAGGRYVAQLKTLAPCARRIVDKMPANFRFLGLIRLALPNARIVHVRRAPLDTCFSCYATLFRGALDFTYDLGELGRYYRSYDALMAHWRAALPETAMLELRYEDLCADFATEAKRLVAFCDLPWNDRCLDFHRTDRTVRTASALQVRRPLYRSAIGRWRPYAAHLAPLIEALGP